MNVALPIVLQELTLRYYKVIALWYWNVFLGGKFVTYLLTERHEVSVKLVE